MFRNPDPSRDAHERTAEFVRLLSAHERRVKGYILALVPNWHTAEEIFAETNARLWEQFADYDPAKDFGAWACTIAHYLVLANRKRQQREAQRFSDTFIEAVAADSTATATDKPDRFHLLSQCLQLIGERSRELVRRYYAGQETIDAIAAATERTPAAVYKSLSRARHWLHKCIEDRLGKEATS